MPACIGIKARVRVFMCTHFPVRTCVCVCVPAILCLCLCLCVYIRRTCMCVCTVHMYVCMYDAFYIAMSVPVTTAWRVLRLWMEERPSDMEGSC